MAISYEKAVELSKNFPQLQISPFTGKLIEVENKEVANWFSSKQYNLDQISPEEIISIFKEASFEHSDRDKLIQMKNELTKSLNPTLNILLSGLAFTENELNEKKQILIQNLSKCGFVNLEEAVFDAMDIVDLTSAINKLKK